MERLTQLLPDGKSYAVGADTVVQDEAGYTGKAVMRLAMYENAHEFLANQQENTDRELEKLRSENRQKSSRFRELLARKLINKGLLDTFEEL